MYNLLILFFASDMSLQNQNSHLFLAPQGQYHALDTGPQICDLPWTLTNSRTSHIFSTGKFRYSYFWRWWRCFHKDAKTNVNVQPSALSWTVLVVFLGENAKPDSKPTTGGVRCIRLYAHRYLWLWGALEPHEVKFHPNYMKWSTSHRFLVFYITFKTSYSPSD